MNAPNAVDAGHWVLSFRCDDRQGIVHAVAGAIAAAQGNITELQQFTSSTGRFFMRVQVQSGFDRSVFEAALSPIVQDLAAAWELDYVGRRRRTLILASKAGHCVNDLLYRQRNGGLPIAVAKIMANHPDLEDLASFYGVPFSSRVVLPETKADFEQLVLDTVAEYDIELVVLARYMQILSPRLCEALAGRAINIHHSFLPGFKGANPYRQAHSRGVKLIGATAHFVTSDLDEGPIIEQNVQRVDHADEVARMVRIGHELESRTLAEAVRLYAEHRILLDGARTVVFR